MRHANRDTAHLNTLRQYFAQNRRIPSYQRIADLLGFASRAAAVKFMGRMEAEGFVVRTVDDDAWMPARRFFEHPLAQATVQAGQPTVAIDVSDEPFLFDDYLVKKPADTVVVPSEERTISGNTSRFCMVGPRGVVAIGVETEIKGMSGTSKNQHAMIYIPR